MQDIARKLSPNDSKLNFLINWTAFIHDNGSKSIHISDDIISVNG